MVYEGKQFNLWKHTRAGYGKFKFQMITTVIQLETALTLNGTIHYSVGDGRIPLDKEELSHKTIEELRMLIRKGIVYVSKNK